MLLEYVLICGEILRETRIHCHSQFCTSGKIWNILKNQLRKLPQNKKIRKLQVVFRRKKPIIIMSPPHLPKCYETQQIKKGNIS